MKVFGYGQKLQIVVNTEREFRAKSRASEQEQGLHHEGPSKDEGFTVGQGWDFRVRMRVLDKNNSFRAGNRILVKGWGI